MKYVIYSPTAKEWFLRPGHGMTAELSEAHRYTREEAKRELAHKYNFGCEMEPVGETHSEITSQEKT